MQLLGQSGREVHQLVNTGSVCNSNVNLVGTEFEHSAVQYVYRGLQVGCPQERANGQWLSVWFKG